jgi:hypothetical protein
VHGFARFGTGAAALADDWGLTAEQKAKAWIYVQGYKGHPKNYCSVIVTTEKDNAAICRERVDYDKAHDKDAAEKYYICQAGYDCDAVKGE